VIVVVAALLLSAVWLALSCRGSNDGVAALLLRALAGLSSADEQNWISAMLAEHDSLDDRGARRRFARGCLRAMLLPRRESDLYAKLFGGLIGAAAIGSLGLAVGGLIHYPGLRTGWLWIVVSVVFAVTVVSYAAIGMRLGQIGSPSTRLVAMMATSPAILIGWWAGHADGVVSSVTVIVLAIPSAIVGTGIARSQLHRDQAGIAVGCVAATSGLFVFVAYTLTTYVTVGGPATTSLRHQFSQSGATDYRTWVVGGNLDGAVFLLLFMPVVAGALGLLSARLASPGDPSAPEPAEAKP
jgi:hypothetical protein